MSGIGIIGCGRLGGLLTRLLSRDFKVFAYDERPISRRIRSLGGVPAKLAEACSQPLVILCVPIRDIEAVLRGIRNLIAPGTLVTDTCSVKEHPARLMKKILPPHAELLATHPSFGPDSAAESLKGLKIILCPLRVRAERYSRIKRYLRGEGLSIIESTPREHDRQMAHSLVLTHVIGRALLGIKAKDVPMDTEGYKRLMRILQTVQNDTWELFEDMNRYNAFAARVRRDLRSALAKLDSRLASGSSLVLERIRK